MTGETWVALNVRQFQNEFMKSSFLPKYEQKIVKISKTQTGKKFPSRQKKFPSRQKKYS